MLLLLVNDQELELTQAHDVETKKHTKLEEIAFSRDETAAGLSRIVFSREQLVITSRLFFKDMFEF